MFFKIWNGVLERSLAILVYGILSLHSKCIPVIDSIFMHIHSFNSIHTAQRPIVAYKFHRYYMYFALTNSWTWRHVHIVCKQRGKTHTRSWQHNTTQKPAKGCPKTCGQEDDINLIPYNGMVMKDN